MRFHFPKPFVSGSKNIEWCLTHFLSEALFFCPQEGSCLFIAPKSQLSHKNSSSFPKVLTLASHWHAMCDHSLHSLHWTTSLSSCRYTTFAFAVAPQWQLSANSESGRDSWEGDWVSQKRVEDRRFRTGGVVSSSDSGPSCARAREGIVVVRYSVVPECSGWNIHVHFFFSPSRGTQHDDRTW